MSEPTPQVLTLAEAAGRLRISVSTAKRRAAAGTLPGVLPKADRAHWRVSATVLEEYLASGARPS